MPAQRLRRPTPLLTPSYPSGARSEDLPNPAEKTAYVRSMFDRIAGRYDLLNRLVSLGLDRAWRRRAVETLRLEKGARVLDVGCGTGDLLAELERASLTAVGVDLSFAMLSAGGRAQSPLVHCDASALPFADGSFDAAVSGFALRNFTDPDRVLAELARVVRPGASLAILEVDRPRARVIRAGHAVWFNAVVPRIGSLLSDAAAYRYLPKSVAYLPSEAELETMLRRAGFGSVGKIRLCGSVAQIVTARRTGAGP